MAVAARCLSAGIVRIMFPTPYENEVEAASKKYNVPPAVIYAVIMTESGFDASAQSYRGAKGLMQIMPDTFWWLVGLRGDPANYSESSLYESAVNIDYGVYFLSYLYSEFEDWSIAFAAYNAGANRVSEWLENEEYSENGRLVDIPFPETAGYVKKVSIAAKIYENLYFKK